MRDTEIAVIGGGASGLFFGHLVRNALIIERNGRGGRKLLLTGGGRCNLTNRKSPGDLKDRYPGCWNFVRHAIYSFPPESIMRFFEERGLPLIEEDNNRIFPASGSAEDVLRVLEKDNQEMLHATALSARKEKDRFIIETDKEEVRARYLVIAAGSAAYPHTGSDGSGYRLAEELGHTIKPVSPALSPLILDSPIKAAGIQFRGAIRYGRKEKRGDIMITDRGISGPAAIDISYMFPQKCGISVEILRISPEEIKALPGKLLLRNALPLPARLSDALLGDIASKRIADLSKSDLMRASSLLSSYKTMAAASGRGAMATRGGVSLEEVDPRTMMSGITEGLFFAGDIMDVNAESGGYFLTWAFSSAYIAARTLGQLHT